MTDYQERIRKLHRDLGIPQEFADTCKIPLQAEADETRSIGLDMFGREQFLAPGVCERWFAMRDAAGEDGITLMVVSAWRSVDYQCQLIRSKLDQGRTIDEILTVNAAPGFSEHHTGRALDLNTTDCEPLSEAFENTEAFRWLQKYAERFGFEMSYPKNNPFDIVYEPWHWACRA
ncbi:MAG: D-alanyl-D-alanine carboxypeptidase family protein [Pseudomonadales bacterium]|nr:D-alanyl-D-alanine carboxypeptidase family protein [Pseudomonadales bacterium]